MGGGEKKRLTFARSQVTFLKSSSSFFFAPMSLAGLRKQPSVLLRFGEKLMAVLKWYILRDRCDHSVQGNKNLHHQLLVDIRETKKKIFFFETSLHTFFFMFWELIRFYSP